MALARLFCGMDEAGRGPLAGPVYAAAVVFDSRKRVPDGVEDSKKLQPAERERLAMLIRRAAIGWAVAWASVEEIDRYNILQASLLAMRRAVEALPCIPDEALVDGLHCPWVGCPTRAIVDGDATVPVIAAASILAKTGRDAEMRRLHERFPQYGFDRHKGYATGEHLEALRRHGPCEVYRRSFAPVRLLLAGADLFGPDLLAGGLVPDED
jgi:ribonuclease HII